MREYKLRPLPARPTSGTPTAAALAVQHARARELIHAHAKATVDSKHDMDDLLVEVGFYDPWPEVYQMIVRVDETRFPSHAAHYRVAAVSGALCTHVHRCCAPHGLNIADLPFITLFNNVSSEPCAPKTLTIPEIDLVFGEFTAPAADADVTYPVGTVLTYPRAVTPAQFLRRQWFGKSDTPVFITFKPCSARLLGGAVPVGRVLSCVRGGVPSNRDYGATPFDDKLLRSFENFLHLDKCFVGNSVQNHYMMHLGFTKRVTEQDEEDTQEDDDEYDDVGINDQEGEINNSRDEVGEIDESHADSLDV